MSFGASQILSGALTHRGAACGSAGSADKTCPESCLPEVALLTISFGHVGKRSE